MYTSPIYSVSMSPLTRKTFPGLPSKDSKLTDRRPSILLDILPLHLTGTLYPETDVERRKVVSKGTTVLVNRFSGPRGDSDRVNVFGPTGFVR